jgi:hypothetical protein
VYKPSVKDLHWAAGFLEGEGCFGSRKRKQKRGNTWYLRVTAGQVNKEPLERVQKMFGGVMRLRKKAKAHHKDCWIWYTDGSRARGIALTLYPLMSSLKQAQIRRGLQPNEY